MRIVLTTFKIIIDSREQAAYTFANIKPKPTIIYKGLSTGDYSLDGYENKITIERKTLADLFGSTGQGRDRFEREFERLSSFDYAALVIEAGLGDIFKRPPVYSKMNPKAVFRTLLVWSIRYDVHVWPCPDRAFAARLTYLLLGKYYVEATEKI